jgi:hypothetical protein
VSADSTAARAAHILHERPTDPALVLDLLTAATARIDRDAPGPQVLVVVPDAEAALSVVDVARDLPAAHGLVPITSVKRAARLVPSGPLALVGGLADLVELLRRSVLKLDQVQQVVVLEAERFDAEAELAMLDALLAELPKEATRVVVAAAVSDAVRDLAERHLHRARRLTAPAPAAVLPALQVMTGAPSARAGALGLLLDDLDPPSVAILADRPADRTAADAAVARLGLPAALATVVGAGGPVPEHVALAVYWGVPSAKGLAAIAAAQPARVVAMVGPRDRRALAVVAAGTTLTPYVPAEGARAMRAADARLRASLRDELARGLPLRELAALEPLFEQYDPADIAAAAVRLLDVARARLAAALAAPIVAAPATPAPREESPRTAERGGERGSERSDARGGSRGGSSGAARGGARGSARSSDRGPRSGDRGPRSGGDRPRGPRDGGAPFRGGAKGAPRGGPRSREGGMREGPKGFGRGRPPRGPEEGGPRKEWQDRGEQLRNSKRRRDD